MAREPEQVMPQPARLLEGLRDTGYNFNTAVADIIDNSIAAEATVVKIVAAQIIDGSIRVSIADNGYGMDHEALRLAMMYGAPERETPHSLGKFGLGLKTASTSCCRRLKVASRSSGGSAVECAIWDLDFIAKKGDWLLQYDDPSDDDLEELDDAAQGESGTLVVWEHCDRLLSQRYSNPNTAAFKNAFNKKLVELEQHIAMVYQRFLDPDYPGVPTVSIFINGNPVKPWDPFCTEIDGRVAARNFSVCYANGDEEVGVARLQCFIVPAKDELDTPEERQRVMPSSGNRDLKGFSEESLSGFYIYRENRLIHWGDWFNMPSIDFHNKLCRFDLSFDAELDEIFQVDIKKSRIILNDDLRKSLIDYVTPIVREGVKRYRGTERKAARKHSRSLHEDAEKGIQEQSLAVRNPLSKNEKGEVIASNRYGTTVTRYSDFNEEPLFKVEEGLTDGILWEPALIQGRNGVRINGGHEFYLRFYGANKDNPSAVTGLDYFFWALAYAETQVIDVKAQRNLEEARSEVSRELRRFAFEMPDVSLEDCNGEEE